MGRKTKAFYYQSKIAVWIPQKSAEKIGLGEGSIITVALNSKNELRIRRISEPTSYITPERERLKATVKETEKEAKRRETALNRQIIQSEEKWVKFKRPTPQ